QLEEKLRCCGAFKIPQSNPKNVYNVCFGFDKALEMFGVRFIKGNVSGNVIDEENLKNQIKASQNKKERIDLLMREYLDDHLFSHSKRLIKSYQESMWKLVNGLVIIFEMDNPLSH